VIQIGIPAIVKYFQPKQTIKRLFIKWMSFTCRQLRLTSFIFGGRRPEEEGTLVHHTWWSWITRLKPPHYPVEGNNEDLMGSEVSYLWDGQLLRVPRHDSVPIVDHRRMLVPIDNITLEPIDETERMLGHPASSAPGGDEVNTVVVYSPPHFKQRLLIFVGFMWLSTSIGFCAMTVLPVIFGRYIFKEQFHVQNEVHDIYSFVLGGSVLLLAGAFIAQSYKSIKEVWSQPTWSETSVSLWNHIKKWSSWGFRWTWFIVSFGIVLPVTFGILIELYFVLPLRQLGQESPTVEVMPMWSHGFACMIILHGFIQIAPDATARNTINEVGYLLLEREKGIQQDIELFFFFPF
jgi:E3 ubiquitin-protein ligase MARCH6